VRAAVHAAGGPQRERFAPTVELSPRGRGENALKERRAESRAVATTRIEALVRSRRTHQAKMFCHDAHSRVLAHGLTSASAIEFFDALPSAEQMMPTLAMPAIEDLLPTRKAAEIGRGGFYRIGRD
jgi:hypothetical protein